MPLWPLLHSSIGVTARLAPNSSAHARVEHRDLCANTPAAKGRVEESAQHAVGSPGEGAALTGHLYPPRGERLHAGNLPGWESVPRQRSKSLVTMIKHSVSLDRLKSIQALWPMASYFATRAAEPAFYVKKLPRTVNWQL